MKPACWKQVQKGAANTSNIMSACDQREVDLAHAMEPFENKNVALCNGSCGNELNQLKVCVDGRPLSFYMSQIGK